MGGLPFSLQIAYTLHHLLSRKSDQHNINPNNNNNISSEYKTQIKSVHSFIVPETKNFAMKLKSGLGKEICYIEKVVVVKLLAYVKLLK